MKLLLVILTLATLGCHRANLKTPYVPVQNPPPPPIECIVDEATVANAEATVIAAQYFVDSAQANVDYNSVEILEKLRAIDNAPSQHVKDIHEAQLEALQVEALNLAAQLLDAQRDLHSAQVALQVAKCEI